jgi:hypothetical protein
MPRKKRSKTINPVDDGRRQSSIKDYWEKGSTKIVLKLAKPKIMLKVTKTDKS